MMSHSIGDVKMFIKPQSAAERLSPSLVKLYGVVETVLVKSQQNVGQELKMFLHQLFLGGILNCVSLYTLFFPFGLNQSK